MLIGIVMRKSVSKTGKDINILYSNINKRLIELGVNSIGIVLDSNYKEIIGLCDGIIFSGGDSFEEYDFEVLRYLYDIDKPTLGICLGMQMMGILFDGEETLVLGHNDTNHDVIINKNSKVYNAYNKNIINVNSRHKYRLVNTSLDIVSRDMNGYIEAIEDKNKKFFIGIQWHPEDIEDPIFKYFIESIGAK